ncbi:hypothetical protein DESME_09630 [Desulfitobacterium metallireducens DSM 15288]|uniref:DUF2922 domain-containing protein n=1 Tax=Desulfitobacterium metallireducens DSM 15288 TaxID=871968 RepID=W0E8T8_9FIRM|nr:DUF2922 domain-containing protein [Desulfitobacterium metallireducens]AHF07260.1 hypothetical protein DESME_09630 [Desulfitobacterium metallireducens DSM 15288]
MALATTQVLKMVFLTPLNKQVTISLNNPKDTLTAAEVQGVMDTMIARNIFMTTNGELASKVSARIIDTTTNELFTA